MIYQGSCHCGKIAYEVDVPAQPEQAVACNCSICQRRGHLLWFFPRSALHLKTPESDISRYTFNKHRIQHCFCPTCGSAPFGLGTDNKGNETVAINVRCLEGVDIAGLNIHHFDGRSL